MYSFFLLFKIDLPSQHPFFGDDISVFVAGIDTPELKGSSDEVKALVYKAKNRMQELLSDEKRLSLGIRKGISISGYWRRWDRREVPWRETQERWLGKGV